MKKKGFTLIELLAVVLILAIIALILIPVVNKIIESARDAANQRSVEGYIGDLNYDIMEKVLLEKNDKIYDGNGVTEFPDLTYNDIIVCDLYDVKDGVIQYAEACTKKDNSWGAFYNYRIGEGAKKVRVLGKSADITGITVQDTVASRDDNTFTVSISGVRKTNIVISSEENVTYVIKKNNNVVNNELLTLKNGDNTFEVTVTSENGKNSKKYTLIVSATNVPTTIEGESILQILNDEDLDTGTYTFTVNGQNYPVHMYVYSGNQNWTDSTIPMKNGFGDQYDVATSASTNAARMVIVKVNGDLTNSSTIKPYSTNYGGPKGFMLYVTGKLTNTGTIDNSHGAKAPGQNVYLWKNTDGSYEMIDAVGAAGLAGGTKCNTNTSGSGACVGRNGNAGSTKGKRDLGGGGQGGLSSYMSDVSSSGASGDATSYSGGSGSGGADKVQANAAAGNGGAGGVGKNSNGNASAYSGAGNPTGGTGGLLIIYANQYVNNGTISAKGAQGGNTSNIGGGSSGGGSINIFTKQNGLSVSVRTNPSAVKSKLSAAGGARAGTDTTRQGGAGGTGTVNIGEIIDGTYKDINTIVEGVRITYTGDSILSILSDDTIPTGYHYFNVNGITYNVHMYVYNGDQTWTTDTIPAKSGFGDSYDVGNASSNATRMVIVKVNGNLTNSATIRPYYNTNYGGPKGFLLYVTGTLTNTGTVDNSHGAKTPGQNVYLWKNANGTYEQVNATGAAGGASVTGTENGNAGKNGSTASKRVLAGGGSGSSAFSEVGNAGGSATSYSGGTGGANYSYAIDSAKGSSVGGPGGTAENNTGGNGAGNPSGGTGGLLVIYANQYNNTGTISAKGANGKSANRGGGSSGGGSINVFTTNIINKGTTNVAGGTAVGTYKLGGAGGTGTVNIGRIVDGSYVAN